MALLDGKQLRNQSTELGKLSGSGIVSFTAATMSFTSGSVLTTATANIVNPTDVVNKEYVDSVAAGLDPKESVAYTTTGNITLSGTSTQVNGDWSEALTDGDRILVKNQTDKTENGIYTADAGSWTRAEDHDGTPAHEVTLGNFTFVEYGTLAGSGYVLHSTNSSNSPIIAPGSDEQEWTLYSSAGAYTAGTGLNLNNGEFEIDATGVAAGSYGSADSITTFTVNDEGQLTTAADTQISIVAEQVTDFDLAAETAIFEDPNFVDGTTIDFTVTAGDSVTAEVVDSSLTSAKLDTGSNGGATAGYVLSVDNNGDFKWKLDEGDISSIDAGNGLIGGGTAGDIQLNLGGTVNDDITFDFGGTGSINFGNAGVGQNSETFSIGTKDFQAFAFNDLGLPASSLHMNNGNSTLSADLMDGTATLMGNTVSLSGNKDVNIIAAMGKASINSPEINVGTGYTTDLKLNGDYTTIEGKTLDVTAQEGLNISTSGTANINGNTFSVGATNFDFQGSNFQQSVNDSYTAQIGGSYSVEAGNVTLKSNGDFNVTTGDGKGLQYTADYSSTFVANSLVTKAYVDSLDAAQITGVDAGAGLSGGGTAGNVALSVNTSNGLSVDGDDVVLGGTLTKDTTIAGGNQELFLGLTSSQITFLHIDAIQAQERYSALGTDVVTIDKNPGGFKLKNTNTDGVETMSANFNTVDIDMHATDAQGNASDLSINTSGIYAIANQGNGDLILVGGQTQIVGQETIDIQGGTLSVGTNAVTISTADFKVDVGTGIEYTSDISANFTDRSLVDKAYVEARSSQPVYQSATSSVATGNTGIALSDTPNDYSRVEVYVNGQLQDLTENTTGDCYFGQAGTILSSLTSGDSLFWNSANAGFELSTTDVVKVHYQA